MDAKSLLLTAAFRHPISEPSIELGFERFRSIAGEPVDYASFCGAVADCLRDGLIREPVRLPEGALQCHWRLELTPAGVNAVRQLLERSPPLPDHLPQGEGRSVTPALPLPLREGVGGRGQAATPPRSSPADE
jgi:hypothetical protein